MSFLSTIGKDFKAVFSWLGSAKGQAVITAGEGIIETINPGLTGIINLAQSWITKAITTETIAAAAGAQDGTGTQKAAAVLSALGPEIAQYFPKATAAQLENANLHIIGFLNAFETPDAA